MSEPPLLEPPELASDDRDPSGGWRGRDVWAVLTAARDGDVRRLQRLIDADASIVHARYWYVPPLHFAVREGHLEAVRLLVGAGADVAYCSSLPGHDTLLRMATDRGHDDVAEYLREQLRSRHASDGARHAIHEAVAAGDAARVSELLAREPALADRGDPLGRRPLHHAVEAGRRDIADVLLDHGATIDATGYGGDDRLGGGGFRPVVLALWHHPVWRQRNDYAMARHLLGRGAGYTITVAAALGDAERVGDLLRADRDLANHQEPGGKRPLSAAAERGHATIVRMLLAAGAEPNLPEGENCPRGYALWAAARFGHREIAEMLLAAGADPNADVESSGTPTESAADAEMRALLYRHGGRVRLVAHVWHGNLDTVAAVLDAKPGLFGDGVLADVFTHAAGAGHESLLRLLLGRGLRVPGVVTGCQTYLWRDAALARLLLEHGMDPDLPSWQQIRPLHLLAAEGDTGKAELFLEFGADAGAVDEEYRSTPLGWAARCGQAEFVRFLLARAPRVDGGAAVPAWARPVAWARRRGHADVVAVLEARRP